MITAPEVARSLYGAWRLARLDPTGLDHFGDDAEAFWRSFYAMLIAAPGFMIMIGLRLSELNLGASPFRIFLVEGISYVIDWFAFPFVMLYVAEQLDRRDRYYRYIAAYNWAVVLQVVLLLVVQMLAYILSAAGGGAGLLGFIAMAAVLVYWWFITRTALDIGGGVAAMIVGLNLGLSLVLNTITVGLLH